MDLEKLAQAHNRLDAKFGADHTDFVVWWHKHPHSNTEPDHPEYVISPRVAYKCQCYRQEFLASKEVGAV